MGGPALSASQRKEHGATRLGRSEARPLRSRRGRWAGAERAQELADLGFGLSGEERRRPMASWAGGRETGRGRESGRAGPKERERETKVNSNMTNVKFK